MIGHLGFQKHQRDANSIYLTPTLVSQTEKLALHDLIKKLRESMQRPANRKRIDKTAYDMALFARVRRAYKTSLRLEGGNRIEPYLLLCTIRYIIHAGRARRKTERVNSFFYYMDCCTNRSTGFAHLKNPLHWCHSRENNDTLRFSLPRTPPPPPRPHSPARRCWRALSRSTVGGNRRGRGRGADGRG